MNKLKGHAVYLTGQIRKADRLDVCSEFLYCVLSLYLQDVCMIDILLFPKKAIAMHMFLQAMHAVMATVVGTHNNVWEHEKLSTLQSCSDSLRADCCHNLWLISYLLSHLFNTIHTAFLTTGFPRNSPSTWSEQLQD